MKVILVQYRPAIRLYKWAVTLQKCGVDVTIGYTTHLGLGLDWSKFKCKHIEKFTGFEKFDYYISFNPNIGISYTRETKVIQAVGDLKSANSINKKEIDILEKSYKCIFISETQRQFAHSIARIKSAVYHNGVIPEMIGQKKYKLNKDRLQLVYSGTITDAMLHHRNIIENLEEIKRKNLCDIHIYPSHISSTLGYEDFIIHKPVSPYNLISELSQYDAGLFVLGNTQVADMALPNKVFEYLAAGLPVLSYAYREVFNYNKGIFFINNSVLPRFERADYSECTQQYGEGLLKCLE